MEDKERKTSTFKKAHPKEEANCLCSLFFCWALPTFIHGWKKDLTENDLYGPLKQHQAQTLTNKLQKVWSREKKAHASPSFRKALMKVFYQELLFYISFLIIQELVIKMSQPLLVGKLLEYYIPNQDYISLREAYGYAAGLILVTLLNVMIVQSSFFGLEHLSIKMQIACRSLVYRKALKLSKTAVHETTVGQMVNLISNDVSRFGYICLHLHQLLISPVQAVIAFYLLFRTVDICATVGIGVLILFLPLLFYMGKLTSRYRYNTAVKADNRIRLMNEIISGIQLIKMYTWEKPFAKLIQIARKLEINEVKSNAFVRSIYMSTSQFVIPVAVFFCILTYVLTGNPLQAHFLFVVTSFYGNIRQALTLHLPRCVAAVIEANISLKRIQDFLLNEEVENDNEAVVSNSDVGVNMRNVKVKWPHSDFALTISSFNASSNQLIAVVGRVGCGKTTLINTILREVRPLDGSLDINGTISFASQEPWLFSSSIRQNILFGQEMDLRKYKQVIKVCALDKDFSLFPYGDRTIVGEKGIMLSGGQKARVNLARAIYKEADIYLLDDPLSAVDVKVGKQIFDECITDYLKNKCTILVTHQIQYLSNVDRIYLLENGEIEAEGTYKDLRKGTGDFIQLLHEAENMNEETDVNEEKLGRNFKKSISITENGDLPAEVKEQRSLGHVSKKVYWRYFGMGGGFVTPILVFLVFVLAQISATGVDYYLTFWVNLEQKKLESQLNLTNNSLADEFEVTFLTSNNLLIIYAFLVNFSIFMVLMRSICFVKFSMTIAKRLHNLMFTRIVKATMRFFNTNPSGRILNRFARDIAIIDEPLPMTFSDSVQVFINVAAITVVISLVNPWIILPTVLVFGLFYGYKTVFLATSRSLKRIESTARSPIYSHLTASLQGLSTIRAFKAEKQLESEFDRMQDFHTSAQYMFCACNRTFGFWLDINCCIYVAIIITSFLFIGTETYGGNVGLAITQSLALTGMLQRGIRQWSDLENEMTSVERVVEYINIAPEPDLGNKIPDENWPEQGKIEFKNLSMRYSEDSPYVLKKLSFLIKPKEKIGIVGRTGAGKSSLATALFRLAPLEGSIKIDDVDTQDIPLNCLRAVISIIPQEPILFSGLLRKNLDPFDEFSDTDLWNALEEVELKQMISELPAGLSSKLAEGGSNFSVGERQLLCLARAIVRKCNILILDEATANVDLQTDQLIQKTIKRKFQDCTVLTIAHRLHTVMESDKILVLDKGCVQEFDHPCVLLQRKGVFSSLVEETGEAMAENLSKMALENFHKRAVSKDN